MANYTTNFDLVKPLGSESYDIDSFHNGSMDKIDKALNGLGSGMAIISKNNTHGAITSGQYVYVHGHGSLAEGLYKATTNIAANGTLSGSNLTAVSGGLGAQVASLSDQIAIKYATIKYNNNVYINFVRFGNVVYMSCVNGNWDSVASTSLVLNGFSTPIVVAPAGFRPAYNAEIKEALNNKRISVDTSGSVFSNETFTNTALRFSGCWITTDAMPT